MPNSSGFKKNDNHLNNHQQKYNESVRQMIAQKNKPSLDHSEMICQRQSCSNSHGRHMKNFPKSLFPTSCDFSHGSKNMTERKFEESFDHLIYQNFIQNDDHCSKRKFPRRNSSFPVEANLKNDMHLQNFKL